MRFLDLARAGAIEVAISPQIIAEVQRVLLQKFKWPSNQVEQLEQRLAAFTRRVTPSETLDIVIDPDDNRILECAKAAGSDYIVTGDDDLLRLGQYEHIRIVKVSDFLDHLGP